jgi:hypothetical protein
MIEKLEDLKREKMKLSLGIAGDYVIEEIANKVDEIIDYLNGMEKFRAEQRKELEKEWNKIGKGKLS